MRDLKSIDWYWAQHLCAPGVQQMALDEAILQWVQSTPEVAKLVVRTYQWASPTLSLGVHQKGQDALRAYQAYSQRKEISLVKRPTGGRAILHGDDVSFAFITNSPDILRMSLDDSYCFFTTWVRRALEHSGANLQAACTPDKRDYMRSPLCFSTQTPSDLLAENGQKVAGSAQLRRQHGLLQHGAAFLKPFEITGAMFDKALFQVIQDDLGAPVTQVQPDQYVGWADQWDALQKIYQDEADETLAKLSITSGSHLLPASD